ncbi:hypothetical protein [Thalassobellus citreus]|uniref:hypothetical protein n=1 Tax=Thalassobellus citreus TaxID=3367752 RepID=UPI00379B3B5A
MNSPSKIPPLRFATEEDFRTPEGQFLLNLEYYEQELYSADYDTHVRDKASGTDSRSWTMEVTNEDTNREWLKVAIIQNRIKVPVFPVLWNQKPEVLNEVACSA